MGVISRSTYLVRFPAVGETQQCDVRMMMTNAPPPWTLNPAGLVELLHHDAPLEVSMQADLDFK
jgi:hypothetical protein